MAKRRKKARKSGKKPEKKPVKKKSKKAKKSHKKIRGEKARPKAAGKRPRKVRYWQDSVPDEFKFHVCDGRELRNLKELTEALDEMSDNIFGFHANNEKNDFSSWIKDVMNHNDLAHNILGKNRTQTKDIIMIYIKKKKR